MNSIWANPEKIGVILTAGDVLRYVDCGPEYDAAVKAGPAPYGGPVVDPVPIEGMPIGKEPEAIAAARQALAESLGISRAALDSVLEIVAAGAGQA